MCRPLDERVIAAKADEKEVNSLISEYTPFLRALIGNIILKPRIYGENELLSAAAEAFWEAIRMYNPDKGHFINIAKLVVKRKLLNLARKEGVRLAREVSFSGLSHTGKDGEDIEFDPPDDKPGTDNPLRWEIEAIEAESLAYGIDFMRLADYSPKAEKTKEVCFAVVRFLKGREDLLAEMRKTCGLPLKKICDEMGADRKTLERHRQYIIVVTLIAVNDYPCLAGWLNLRGKGVSA